jgi:hypothetical protein
MAEWVELFSAPTTTVSPTGLVQGQAPNNGANFGPDTRATTTSGIQEALDAAAAAGGGRVLCLVGVYSVSSPLVFAGANVTLEFEPGCSLTFANGITGTKAGTWYSGIGAITPTGLIWMGSNPSSGATYSHQHLVGNGLQVNFGSNDPAGGQQDGITIMFPGQASSPAFTGSVSDISVEGVIGVGGVFQFLHVVQDNFNKTNVPYPTFPRFLLLKDIEFTANTQSNLNNSGGSVLYLVGGIESRVEGCRIDCSAMPTSFDYDPINLSGTAGEVFHWYIARSYFRGNGASGQCGEFQGVAVNTRASDGLHDCVLEQCTFDSGAASGAPLAGSSGLYIDDAVNNSTTDAFVSGLEFRRCIFINTGCSLSFAYQSVSVGTSPWTYTNNSRATQLLSVSGGTVSSVTVNGSATGQTSGLFLLKPTDTVTVTYSSAPTASVVPAGRIRFVGSLQPGVISVSGTASGRFPGGQQNGGYVGVPASGSALTNVFGFPVLAYVQGGTVSAVALNLLTVASSTNVLVPLQPGDSIKITWTSAPSLNFQPL